VKRQAQIERLTRGEELTPTRAGDTGAGPEHWYERGTLLRRTSLVTDPPDGKIPGYVVFLYEMIHDARFIPLDGRPHLGGGLRQWMGDSRGRWDGNTLVVEVTNFTENTAIRFGGEYHSGELRIVERFTPVDADTIDYQFTVHDPKTWTQPWTVSIPMRRDGSYEMYEYACHEGNYSMSNRLSGQRAEEKAGPEGK
jgi:hypothetical protein